MRFFQPRILEWAAISFSRGSCQPRNWIHVSWVSCIAGRFFTTELSGKPGLPTPVFLPGDFHGQRGLAGYSPWGHKESHMSVRLTQAHDCKVRVLFLYTSHLRPVFQNSRKYFPLHLCELWRFKRRRERQARNPACLVHLSVAPLSQPVLPCH